MTDSAVLDAGRARLVKVGRGQAVAQLDAISSLTQGAFADVVADVAVLATVLQLRCANST